MPLNFMWTANIVKVINNLTTIDISVEFYRDGILQSDFLFINADIPTVQTRVLNRIKELEANDKIDTSSLLGAVDLTPPAPPKPPTQDEIDKQNYFTLLSKWETAKLDIDKGLLDKANSDFIKLDSDLKAAYKPEYSGL